MQQCVARGESLFAERRACTVACERLQICLFESQGRSELLVKFEGPDRDLDVVDCRGRWPA
jgi:hypothetical protein